MACNSKMAGCGVKRSEIWGLREHGVPLTFLVLKVIWGSFCVLVSNWPVTPRWLDVERNGVKFGTLGQL